MTVRPGTRRPGSIPGTRPGTIRRHLPVSSIKLPSNSDLHRSTIAMCKHMQRVAVLRYCPSREECAICNESLHNRTVKYCPCQHVFHVGCLRKWENVKGQDEVDCPLCRTALYWDVVSSSSSSSGEEDSSTKDDAYGGASDDSDRAESDTWFRSGRYRTRKKRRLNDGTASSSRP
jgi:hypothetical protein